MRENAHEVTVGDLNVKSRAPRMVREADPEAKCGLLEDAVVAGNLWGVDGEVEVQDTYSSIIQWAIHYWE
jgi:hypothetical protein